MDTRGTRSRAPDTIGAGRRLRCPSAAGLPLGVGPLTALQSWVITDLEALEPKVRSLQDDLRAAIAALGQAAAQLDASARAHDRAVEALTKVGESEHHR